MGNAFFVVWRESLEAFLIAGILFAWLQANDPSGKGKRALFGGLAAGAGLALLQDPGSAAPRLLVHAGTDRPVGPDERSETALCGPLPAPILPHRGASTALEYWTFP